jgi:hypothetical protein
VIRSGIGSSIRFVTIFSRLVPLFFHRCRSTGDSENRDDSDAAISMDRTTSANNTPIPGISERVDPKRTKLGGSPTGSGLMKHQNGRSSVLVSTGAFARKLSEALVSAGA